MSFHSDLDWWSMFLSDWNGVSLLSTVVRKPPDVTITSDASGNCGGRAFSSTREWFQCPWQEWKDVHITVNCEAVGANCDCRYSLGVLLQGNNNSVPDR